MCRAVIENPVKSSLVGDRDSCVALGNLSEIDAVGDELVRIGITLLIICLQALYPRLEGIFMINAGAVDIYRPVHTLESCQGAR